MRPYSEVYVPDILYIIASLHKKRLLLLKTCNTDNLFYEKEHNIQQLNRKFVKHHICVYKPSESIFIANHGHE